MLFPLDIRSEPQYWAMEAWRKKSDVKSCQHGNDSDRADLRARRSPPPDRRSVFLPGRGAARQTDSDEVLHRKWKTPITCDGGFIEQSREGCSTLPILAMEPM